MKHIDALASYQQRKKNTAPVIKKLTQSCSTLKSFGPEVMELYHKLAIEMFESAEPPAAAEYSGVSERIKKIIEQKIAIQLDQEYEGQEEK